MFQSALRSFSRPVDSHVLHSLATKGPSRINRHYAARITKQSFSSFSSQFQNGVATEHEASLPVSSPESATIPDKEPPVDQPLIRKQRSKKKKGKRGAPESHKPKPLHKNPPSLKPKAQGKAKSKKEADGSSVAEAQPRAKTLSAKSKLTRSQRLLGSTGEITESDKGTIESMGDDVIPLDIKTAPVPNLSFGLDRVIFNPGVYHLRDPRTRVYNFDPYLDSIMPVSEFDFEALKEYITSSKDEALIQLARDQKKKYVGSSSSMTGVLSHFHYLLSDWRPVNRDLVSSGFPDKLLTFTRLLRSPAAMFLHYKDGVYAIDADKEFDTANILMNLGKSMEKLLTLPKEEFERYRKSSENKISAEEEQAIPEAYHYSTLGDFVMRSQLDGYDPRLPGTGMFDLKTRAVVSIRMDVQNFRKGMGYEIKSRFGMWESFEREYYDMIRAAFLKYSLQVRVGRMDGIFVAFHNIERIFGFQYIPLSEMDQALHGQQDQSLGDREFQMSLKLWNLILDKATAKFPKQSLRLHFETRDGSMTSMRIYAEPVTGAEIQAIQEKNKAVIEKYQRELLHPELFAQEQEEEAARAAEQAEAEAEAEAEAAAERDAESKLSENMVSAESGTVSAEVEAASAEDTPDAARILPEEPIPQEPRNEEAPQPRLMGMVLSIVNRVNGKVVKRPNKITSKDHWTVEYELSELNNNTHLQSQYRSLKKRRANTLAFRGEDETFYISRLRKIAEAGRAYRAEQDRLDRENGIAVYEPITSVSQNDRRH